MKQYNIVYGAKTELVGMLVMLINAGIQVIHVDAKEHEIIVYTFSAKLERHLKANPYNWAFGEV